MKRSVGERERGNGMVTGEGGKGEGGFFFSEQRQLTAAGGRGRRASTAGLLGPAARHLAARLLLRRLRGGCGGRPLRASGARR